MPEKRPWSVVVTGRDHSYASEIWTFDDKDKAEERAKEIGGAYVVFGTQMWNEPLGQIEESDKPARVRFIAGEA